MKASENGSRPTLITMKQATPSPAQANKNYLLSVRGKTEAEPIKEILTSATIVLIKAIAANQAKGEANLRLR